MVDKKLKYFEKPKSDVLIIIHDAPLEGAWFNFDILVKEPIYKAMEIWLKENGYELYDNFCPIAETFCQEHKEYLFLGSEDFGHASNAPVLRFLIELGIFCHKYNISFDVIHVKIVDEKKTKKEADKHV